MQVMIPPSHIFNKPNPVKLRPYQKPVLDAFNKWTYPDNSGYCTHLGSKRMYMVHPRQSGKDFTVGNCYARAIKNTPNGRFAYMFPTLKNVKQIMGKGNRIWNLFPSKRNTRNKSEWFLTNYNGSEGVFEFANGAYLFLVGSNNYDTILGETINGMIFSEWQNADPSAWLYLEPMLTETNGFAMFIGTPRGKNHFYHMYNQFKKKMDEGDNNYFADHKTIEETRHKDVYWTREQFETMASFHGEEIAELMVRQEYWCSWEAGKAFSIYGKEMSHITNNGFIQDLFAKGAPHPDYPIHSAWDLGRQIGTGETDPTYVIVFQAIPNKQLNTVDIYILDYYYNNYESYTQIANEFLIKNNYNNNGYIIMPRDFFEKASFGENQRQWLRKRGFILKSSGTLGIAQGIQTVRENFRLGRIFFDIRCDQPKPGKTMFRSLCEDLRQYSNEWDEEKRILKPLHDYTSHAADAFRYLFTGLRKIQQDQLKDEFNPHDHPGQVFWDDKNNVAYEIATDVS